MIFFENKTKLEKHLDFLNSRSNINGLAIFFFNKIYHILIILSPIVLSILYFSHLSKNPIFDFFAPFFGIVYTIFTISLFADLVLNFSFKGAYNYFSYIKNCFSNKYSFKDFYQEKEQALKLLYEIGYTNLEMEMFIDHIKINNRISSDDLHRISHYLEKDKSENNEISSSEIVKIFHSQYISEANSKNISNPEEQDVIFFSQKNLKNK